MLLGVDVGSSGCKALAFDVERRMTVGRGSSAYAAQTPFVGALELDPEHVWESVVSSIRQAVQEAGCRRLQGLSIVSAGLAVLPVDKRGNPLSSIMLPGDRRAVDEAEAIAAALGPDAIYGVTGITAHALYGVPKYEWVKRHRPDLFKRTSKFLSLDTYVQMRMGLEPTFDATMACRTLALDINQRVWWSEALRHAGLSADMLPALGDASRPLGVLSDPISSALGIEQGTIVYVGCHDQTAANLGAGGLSEGILTASLGTMDGLCIAFSESIRQGALMKSSLFTYPHVLSGMYHTLAMLPGIGVLPRWIGSLVAGGGSIVNGILESGPKSPAASGGSFLLPYLIGSPTPSLNPLASGVIWGLTIGTTPEQLIQGVLDGAALEARRNLELLRRHGFRWNQIRATGGGSRWPGLMQLRADVTGEPWAIMPESEASALGAVILAGLGSGAFDPEAEAYSICGAPHRIHYPDQEAHAGYEELYHQYLEVAEFAEAHTRFRQQGTEPAVLGEGGNAER